ncbi:MAG: hypothetical protein Ct9H300mP3_07520 [Gammaproteobacteria bacterium]|nr:MAG: hypothetical protein Ct9H300mP3_07520 [Gammaproteobacteria bacterium]
MFGRNIRRALVLLKITLEQDSESTKEMLKTYYSYSQGNAKEEDLDKANKQLNLLLKELGFGFLTILPFAPITIPLLVKFARKHKIDIVPEWFKDSLKK